MKRSYQVVLLATALMAAVTIAMVVTAGSNSAAANNTAVATAKPTLSVSLTRPQKAVLPLMLSSSGNISAWQEASIGNEANGLKLEQVLVNVGDVVKRGQLLASFAADTVRAELAQSQAAVTEAEALLAEASADVKRTAELQASGALSTQQIQQYRTAEKASRARLQSAQASLHIQQLRLKHTQVLAPDDGIISARAATVGAVLPVGQELFRLIRGSRLEWRAQVSAADLAKLTPGQRVYVTPVGADTITGTLRMISPVVDIQSRNALVYVDLPLNSQIRAGSFARGSFDLGTTEVLTLPQSAVLLRDGFSYVMQVDEDARVIPVKVRTGRRTADLVEIISGVTAAHQVVLTGGAFLGAGDLVQIVADKLNARPIAAADQPAIAFTASSDDAM